MKKFLGVILMIIGTGSMLIFKTVTGSLNGGFGIFGAIIQWGFIVLGASLVKSENKLKK